MAQDPLAPLGAPSRPALPPVKPVTQALDPSTLAWMKAQSAYTRSILDAIPPRAALERKIASFTGSFGFTRGYANCGGRAFYEERTPASDPFDLVVEDSAGKRKIVDVADSQAINYFFAHPTVARSRPASRSAARRPRRHNAATSFSHSSATRRPWIGSPLARVVVHQHLGVMRNIFFDFASAMTLRLVVRIHRARPDSYKIRRHTDNNGTRACI